MDNIGNTSMECGKGQKALVGDEHRYGTAIGASTDGFWLLDQEGRILDVNDAYAVRSGYTRDELLTMRVSDFEVIEIPRETAAHFEKIITDGNDTFETMHRAKDGTVWNVEVTTAYAPDNGGQFAAFLRDISKRKQAEEARTAQLELLRICNRACSSHGLIRELLSFFRKLVGCEAVGIRLRNGEDFPYFKTCGFSQDFVFAENSLCKIISEDKVEKDGRGRIVLDCMCGAVLSGRFDAEKTFFTARGSFWSNCTTELLASTTEADRQGGTRNRCNREGYESVALIPFHTRDEIYGLFQFNDKRKGLFTAEKIALLEESVGYVAIALAKLRGDEALHESENRLRFALEGTNDGLWDMQLRTGTTYLSPRGWEILGYGPNEVGEIGNMWTDLVHRDDLPLANERLRAHFEGRAPIFEVEQRLRMKCGSWKWVLARGKVVSRDETGTPLRMTGTHTDLTGQKKLQEQLGQAQKMESMGRLAGGVAHDFNNKLSIILAHAELARRKEEASLPLRAHLEHIQKAAEGSADIVRQLLAIASRQTAAPLVLNLIETVANQLNALRDLVGQCIELVWLPDEELWPIKMDPAQIDQILVNLCINARDAITATGTITIQAKNQVYEAPPPAAHTGFVPGEYVLLLVRDDGCGIGQEALKKVFEPFYTTKEVGQGSGLGLSIVYGIVKQNGGFIEVCSEPGQGTTCKIYIPRYQGREEQPTPAHRVHTAERGRETLLLVEDELEILDVLKELLEAEGYRVLAAATPCEALRVAEEHTGEIHLLITDVVMPGMNGQQLATRLLSLYPGLELMFMSGYTADAIAHGGMLDEGVQFIQKPFSLDNMAAKVRQALDR